MINSLKELQTLITEINENIDRYSTDDGRKIKKNNEEIEKLVATLSSARDVILKRLRKYNQDMIPLCQDESIFLTEEKIKNEEEILGIINGYNNAEILGINNILYELDKSTVMGDIVSWINKLLQIFSEASVNLTIENFDYSLSVKEFMTTFLNYKDNKDIFEKEIKESFEAVYWKNPDTIKEIILNFRVLLNTFKKELDAYVKIYVDKILDSKNPNDIFSIIKQDIINLDNTVNYDLYLTLNRFLEEKDNINDYQLDSKTITDTRNKIINEEVYNKLSEDENKDFYNNIKCLYDSTKEYEFIKKYEPLVKEVIAIYSKKDELKDEQKNKLIALDKLYKEKDKIDKNLHGLLESLHKMNNPSKGLLGFLKPKASKSDEINNKISIAEKEADAKIDEIKAEYNNIVDIEFNNLVINSLNESSTIYNALCLYLKNIVKLKISVIKHYPDDNMNELIDKFTKFLYSPYNVIINTLKLKDNLEFNNLIVEKYRLYNINCEIADTNKELKKNINILLKDYYLNKCRISREDIKLICAINKIKDPE